MYKRQATEGVTVTEEAEKVQPSIVAAEADNKAQTAEMCIRDRPRTDVKAERKVLKVHILVKFWNPIQSSKAVGAVCLKS